MEMEKKQLFRLTPKAYVAGLPRLTFQGRIVVVQGEWEAGRAVRALRSSAIVGIDTETRPNFRKGRTNRVSLLQISTEEVCFLFRLNHIGFTQPLIDLLEDESVPKVGLSLNDDFYMLRELHAVEPRNVVDLQDVSKQMGLEDMSLQKLAANLLHMRISKTARLTNWEADVLSNSQRVYAATDAYACIVLYREMTRLMDTGAYTLVDAPAADPAESA